MNSWLVLVALAAAPASSSPLKLAAPTFSCVNLDEKNCTFFTDHFAGQLAETGRARVTTQSEISALIGFEQQKQLLGCSNDSTSCLAEMAGALGVDGLVIGNIARFDNDYVVNLKIMNARDGQPIAAWSKRTSGHSGLLDALAAGARQLSRKLATLQGSAATAKSGTSPEKAPPAATAELHDQSPEGSGPGWKVIVPGAVGGALLAGGGTFVGLAHMTRNQLHDGRADPTRTQAELDAIVGRGAMFQTVGFSLVAAGAVALGVAGGLWVWGGADDGATASVMVTPSGGALVLSGVWP
jgi:hypothetical protein